MAEVHIAIIGAGPAAFYAAEYLLKSGAVVSMFELLPTPYGLVRGGVAPDHQKIKSVTKVYDRIAANPNFRYYGNVEFGRDLLHEDLPNYFHAVIYATGAQSDRHMNIPGEDLPGSHAATEFVAWYNGHPFYRDSKFDLSVKAAAVIGNGNVAMDVARILERTPEELAATDIADYALEALSHSQIETVYILGRRGPAQAAYTTPEIKELGELAAAEVIVSPQDAEIDPLSAELIQSGADRTMIGNVEAIRRYAAHEPEGKPRKIVMRFLVSPLRLIGTDHVEGIEIVKNRLVASDDGSLRPKSTGETEILPVGLVFRSIGYKGTGLPGVPFNERDGVIPNAAGRVVAQDLQIITGEYVTGWIKRGPSGIIGTNKPDSVETATNLLKDVNAGRSWHPANPHPEAVEALLETRAVDYVTYADWRALDADEVARGKALGRPRLKFTSIEEMLAAIRERRQQPTAGD
ncbi:MAG: FAD-dependent oxidoreductase [Anaerolineae bacterium]|nr:FAD-dependent oxidoreductase [Anaerolineae bacterium]